MPESMERLPRWIWLGSPLDEHDIRDAWMVGDRSSDVEAGKENGQTVIGRRYAGFGGEQELKGSDVVIHSFHTC